MILSKSYSCCTTDSHRETCVLSPIYFVSSLPSLKSGSIDFGEFLKVVKDQKNARDRLADDTDMVDGTYVLHVIVLCEARLGY